ncbi:MAG: S8 family peptidase [Bacteroidetes bacterium]|nr:S8 family peptidase [Bacteroidota bacterium]
MKNRIVFIAGFLCLLAQFSFGQTTQPATGGGIWYNQYQKQFPQQTTNFAVKGNAEALQRSNYLYYKYATDGWHFIRCTPEQLRTLINQGIIEQIYFEPSYPSFLNDTMRLTQNIDSVLTGYSPLQVPFTGKNVIVGYVDSGIDYTHGDFKNADGSTRVLYYWDQTLGYDALLTPGKYGYGQVWDSASINNGTCLSMDNNAHGTTVAGTGSGNGLANGSFKGAAPESDIIMVETDFSAANWTMTVADAVDFIFSMADTLGKPAVVNTSVGDYLGSHDGLDPASLVIDSLLNDKPGRIVVAAAGNSGAQGKYHVKANVTADTSFCWLIVNPSSAFGVPAVYFDMWADTADFNNVNFAFAADNTTPWEFRARTQFYNIQSVTNTTVFDSIMVGSNKLAPVEFTTQLIGGVYHLELLISNPDSADYMFRFETVGAGEYDLWSGTFMGLSTIRNTLMPTVLEFPPVAYYNYPDTLSTTVSSWTCSEKVVTVGNVKNQKDYLDVNGNLFTFSGGPVGELSANSSKGPNRLGYTKPDVVATGDATLSACPAWLQANLLISNPAMLAQGGLHVRNGGTSMASPVIAGIAALYLEKCPDATYQDFIDALHTYGYDDLFTGTTPNNAYGYGKVNAFYLLNQSNFPVTLLGDSVICSNPVLFETAENNFVTYLWQDGSTGSSIIQATPDTVSVVVTNDMGCKSYSDSMLVIQGALPDFPIINVIGGGLITVAADSLVWFYEGNVIPNSNSQYYNPDTTGTFSVEVFSADGCSFMSDPVFIDLSQIHELTQNEFVIFPNPFTESVYLIKNEYYDLDIVITDVVGNLVYKNSTSENDDLFITIDLPEIASGTYLMSLYYGNNFKSVKLIKN